MEGSRGICQKPKSGQPIDELSGAINVTEAVLSPDPEDGRGKLVYLTEAGRIFRNQAIVHVSEVFGHLIGPDQLAIMQRTKGDLAELRKYLDNNR